MVNLSDYFLKYFIIKKMCLDCACKLVLKLTTLMDFQSNFTLKVKFFFTRTGLRLFHYLNYLGITFLKISTQKNTTVNQSITVVNVTRPGFEPRHSESESDVLPLYYRAVFQ